MCWFHFPPVPMILGERIQALDLYPLTYTCLMIHLKTYFDEEKHKYMHR